MSAGRTVNNSTIERHTPMPPRSEPMRRGKGPDRVGRKKAAERRRASLSHSPLGKAKGRSDRLKLRDEADKYDARFVKLRDGFVCRQGKAEAEGGHRPADSFCEGPLDCGHLYPKGKFPAVRHEDLNIHAQCRRHNKLHVRVPHFYMTWFDETYGRAEKDRLHALAVSERRYSAEDLRKHIERRKEQIAQLEADRMVTEAA